MAVIGKESSLAVNVYYEDISYRLVSEQSAMTFEQLVVYIG
jgi:hypothetical protein